MADDDKRISELDPLTQADDADLLAIVDVSEDPDLTMNITTQDLFASPRPIGATNPSSGKFTTLSLPTGSTIAEFSTDGTLVGNSDTAVPTERAVKTYVDTQIASISAGYTLRHVSSNDNAVDAEALLVDTTNGDVTITLINTGNGRYIIKKITSDSNVVYVQGNSGLVDGNSQFIISQENESYTFLCDASNFYAV
jgi:hypothetical protein